METFFSRKNIPSPYFLIFPNLKNFWFFAKRNLINRVEKTILRIIQFDTHSTANLSPLAILKNSSLYSKTPKNKLLNAFRSFTISVAFYGKFATIWLKKIFTFKNKDKRRERKWQTSGEKRSRWVEDFVPILYNIAPKIRRYFQFLLHTNGNSISTTFYLRLQWSNGTQFVFVEIGPRKVQYLLDETFN